MESTRSWQKSVVVPVKEKLVEFDTIVKNLQSKHRKTFIRDNFCCDFNEDVETSVPKKFTKSDGKVNPHVHHGNLFNHTSNIKE